MKHPFQFLSTVAVILFLNLPQSMSAQCPNTNAEAELNGNNIRTTLRLAGDMWWDGNDGEYTFAPASPGVATPSSLFFGGFWISGLDPVANLYNSINFYGQYVHNSFGPINSDFNRFWEVRKEEIDQHIADYEDNGSIDGPVPEAILNWPGKDNPHFSDQHGFELPEDRASLAPFIDLNENDIYEPMLGDVPDIKNASQGIWWAFSDACDNSFEYQKVGVEVHCLAYVYESEDPVINNTSFYEWNVFKTNQNPLQSVYMSLFVDPDLGCPSDDFIGFNEECNMAYAYNSDMVDGVAECTCPGGISTFCEEIPLVGIKFLDNTSQSENLVSSFIYTNNASIGFPSPSTTDPQTAFEVFQYQNGNWRDGTPLTEGGSGFDPISSETTAYAFGDAPDDPNGWSMCTTDLEFNDRRLFINTGPYEFQSTGSQHRLNFAVIMVEDIPHPCPDITPLLEACQVVENHYNDLTSSVAKFYPSNPELELDISPNPMTDHTTFSFDDPGQKIKSIELFSSTGRLVKNVKGLKHNRVEINRAGLEAGLYFYRIRSTRDNITAGKLIIY